jgi:MFS family permease
MANGKMKRWTVLIIVATVMMMGYVFWDIVSPLSTTLKAPITEGGMAWSAEEYGFYAGSYSIFNIFLLMLFIGGIILDKTGIRFTGFLATGMMMMGALTNYYALSHISPHENTTLQFTLFGLIPEHIKTQVLIAALGFGIFGVGCDLTGITVSKIVTKWFTGHELASAMGIQVAMARLGTASAISFSPLIAQQTGIAIPFLVGAALLVLAFILFIIYVGMDIRQDTHGKLNEGDSDKPLEKGYSLKSCLVNLASNRGYWLIALLCVCFYSSLRPFLKFATDVLVNKYHISEVSAGLIVSLLPYGTIVLTPLFGSLYDRIGRGASLMLCGCIILTACHIGLIIPWINATWYATIIMILMGVSFSLVPSAMWPSVPKIVPLQQLGTAYSIIYYIQNIGLMLVPMWAGNLIGAHTSSAGHTDFTVPMLVFICFGVASIILSAILLWFDHHYHYGLEKANIISNEELGLP